MINPLFIKNIEFTPGAFTARFGDKSSSAMNVSLLEGSFQNYEFDIDISMGGAGLRAEGPIFGEKGSFILGSIWSYFDLIVTNIGLTSLPYFNNHQTKIVYKLNQRNSLIFNGILALNNVSSSFEENDQIAQSYYGIPAFSHDGKYYLGGLTLKSILSGSGYGMSTLSYIHQHNFQTVFDFGLEEYAWFTSNNTIRDLSFKTDWVLQTKLGEISTGLLLKNIDYDHNEWVNAKISFKYDTTYWNGDEWDFPDDIDRPEELYPLYIRSTIQQNANNHFTKFALYGQNTFSHHKFLITTGLRLDYFSGTDRFVFSPRINLEYQLNQISAFHLALGRHYQFPDYFMLNKSDWNNNLKTEYADHIVFGVEHFFSDDFRATIELYHKYYNNIYTHYYWSNEPEKFPEQLDHFFDWLNKGKKNNTGIEFFLKKKLTKNWHGILSYSLNYSNAKDVRSIKQYPEINNFLNDGQWYPWDYDNRHKLTIMGGWKEKFSNKNWYRSIKSTNLYKFVEPFSPLADEIELSFRFTYSSGNPYTPKTYYPDLYEWQYSDNIEWNGSRHSDYQRLDLMFLKRHHLKKMNLVIYVNFMNILNRNNEFEIIYNQNGTKETVWLFKTLPIGGITIEI